MTPRRANLSLPAADKAHNGPLSLRIRGDLRASTSCCDIDHWTADDTDNLRIAFLICAPRDIPDSIGRSATIVFYGGADLVKTRRRSLFNQSGNMWLTCARRGSRLVR